MHELSLTRRIVETCTERAGGRRVRAVQLEVGKLSGVEVDALRFCFDVVTAGTALEGARLQIDEVDGAGRCDDCGERVALSELVGLCDCGKSGRLRLTAGDELRIMAMEV